MEKCQIPTSLTLIGALLKWGDVDFNQSEKGIKSKIDILLILTNHYFHAPNLSVKNGENNGVLAGVPFLSPSRAQIPLPLPLLTPATQAKSKRFPPEHNLPVREKQFIQNKQLFGMS